VEERGETVIYLVTEACLPLADHLQRLDIQVSHERMTHWRAAAWSCTANVADKLGHRWVPDGVGSSSQPVPGYGPVPRGEGSQLPEQRLQAGASQSLPLWSWDTAHRIRQA
jgi:hypothetical protein